MVFFSLGVLKYVVCLCRGCDGWFNFFDGFIKIRLEIVPFSFPRVKASSEWSRLWHNNWVDSHTDRAVLCAGDWIQNRLLTHIRNVSEECVG